MLVGCSPSFQLMIRAEVEQFGKVPWRLKLEWQQAFCWEAKGVRFWLTSTLASPSEQVFSYEVKEPNVLYSPSSTSIHPWLLFFFKGLALDVVFRKDSWLHQKSLLIQ